MGVLVSFTKRGKPFLPSGKIRTGIVCNSLTGAGNRPISVPAHPVMVNLAQKRIAVQGAVEQAFRARGEGVDGLDHGAMGGGGVDVIARIGRGRAQEVFGEGGVKEADVFDGRSGVAADDEASQGVENGADGGLVGGAFEGRGGVDQEREGQDWPGAGDGQGGEDGTEAIAPAGGRPAGRLLQAFRIRLGEGAGQSGQIEVRLGDHGVGQKRRDQPLALRPGKDGRARRLRDAAGRQIGVEGRSVGRLQRESTPRRASRRLRMRRDDQAQGLRPRPERRPCQGPGRLAELIEAVEDDPHGRDFRQVGERTEQFQGEVVEPLPLLVRHGEVKRPDRLREAGDGSFQLRLQVAGEADLGRLGREDPDRLDECLGDGPGGQLGPHEGRRQRRLSHSRSADHDHHRLRQARFDSLAKLLGGLKIPGTLEDRGASLALFPEDVAGIPRRVAAQVEIGVEGRPSRGMMGGPQPAEDVEGRESIAGLRVAVFEDFDQRPEERRAGRLQVIGRGQQLEAAHALHELGPGGHRLLDAHAGMAGVDEHAQPAKARVLFQAFADALREMHRTLAGGLLGVGRHQEEMAVLEVAVADVGEDQRLLGQRRASDRLVDRGPGLIDARIDQQPRRMTLGDDARALAGAVGHQRVEPQGDVGQETQPAQGLALRADDEDPPTRHEGPLAKTT
ncbi:hypothetical protein PZE19_27305 [Paludisphaera sp. Pla2]|uniref:Uncharacterized protein n=1 Tax=Paludisphaera mucosa TaxID=3030827 RepID=A0ABT6FIS4_9BACT|nr:hypothetical protein [Paludisphaera mucosa]MDG3007488.1 hypothetical protein [Paludisphaera mucosa]